MPRWGEHQKIATLEGRAQVLRRGQRDMDVALAAPRHGWRMAACPRSNACAREPRRRRGRTGSQDPWLLGVFSSNSPKAKQFGRQDKSWASRRHIGYAPKTQRPDAERRLLRYHAERGNDQNCDFVACLRERTPTHEGPHREPGPLVTWGLFK